MAQYTPVNESNLEIIHVSPTGNDNNAGTNAAPFRTLKKALDLAGSKKAANVGVKVLIAPGIYREGSPTDDWAIKFNFQPEQATAAPLVIEGAGWDAASPRNTGGVILSGSEDWSGGWTKNADGTWSKDWPYAFGVPPKGVSFGVSDAFLRREWVHVNGKTYYQINPPNYTNQNGQVDGPTTGPNNINGGRLTADEGAFWVTDAVVANNTVTKMGKITIKLPASTPAGFDLNASVNLVEVTTKQNLLQLWLREQSPNPTNVVIRNLTFQHWGENYPVLVQHQNNLLIEDCRFIKNKRQGLAIIPAKNVLVRRVDCSENGENGAGMTDVTNAVWEDCKFNRNSRQGEIVGYTGWSVCGIKFYSASAGNQNLTLLRCEAIENRSTGFWWDTGNFNCQMVESVALRNGSEGVFIEANSSADNNYENPGTGTKGTGGIPNLGSQHTVKALRCVFAGNRPLPGAEAYRKTKGSGVFIAECENVEVDGCLIYDNDIQISTYDNIRAENRNFSFRNNVIAAQNANQRIYAVASPWDSGETISAQNANGTTIATFKGGWYAMFDALSVTTNDNLYHNPSATAFFNRTQRWGTDRWASQPDVTANTLTLAGWQAAHLNNPNNSFANKAVDSRSRLVTAAYDDAKPLVAVQPLVTSLAENAPSTDAFRISRVSAKGYGSALTVTYTVRTNAGDAANGVDFEALSGSVVIPAGSTSAVMKLKPLTDSLSEGTEKIALVLSTSNQNFAVGNPSASIDLTNSSSPSGSTFSGYYRLTVKHSGKALDVRSASTADGAVVQQYTPNGTKAQNWNLTAVGNGYYKLVAQCSGKALDVAGASQDNGATLQQWSYGNTTGNQDWKIEA
ncbi:MAG: RICIN domain-containing protein, partial [Cytophagales bacterium]|nr:RICIN domain-containing protein [Cytophagales bacterium]